MTTSKYPGDERFAAERAGRRAADRAAALAAMPDTVLAGALLSRLWRCYDAAGMSYGRSREGRLLEAAKMLLRLPSPSGREDEWPSEEALLGEAKRRNGPLPRLVKR